MQDLKDIELSLKEIVSHLCYKIGPRSIYNYPSLKETALYIKNKLSLMGFEPWSQVYKVMDKEVENIAVFMAEAPQKPYYLFGAHYDTVSLTLGADDNASSVAVCLEALRIISEKGLKEKIPPCAFVFFTLEEPPFFGTKGMGSRKFVKWAKSESHKIKGALIFEMVGYYCFEKGCQKYPPFIKLFRRFPDIGNFIGVIGDAKSKRLVSEVVEVFKANKALPVEHIIVPFRGFLLPQTRLSDNASFWDAGYSAVMITDTAYFRNPYYHTKEDVPETLNYEKMAHLVKNIINFLLVSKKG